jgi:hypothetical protein
MSNIGRRGQKIGTFKRDLSYNLMVKEKKADDFSKFTSYIFHSATENLSHRNRIHLKY